jgi:hypothetical protein
LGVCIQCNSVVQVVTMERVSPHRSKAPDPKIIVKPIEYVVPEAAINVFESSR